MPDIPNNSEKPSVIPSVGPESVLPNPGMESPKGVIQGHEVEKLIGQDPSKAIPLPKELDLSSSSITFTAKPLKESIVNQLASVITRHEEYKGKIESRVEELKKMLESFRDSMGIMANITDENEIEILLQSFCEKIASFEMSENKEMRFSKQVVTGDHIKIPFTFNLTKKEDGNINVSITYPATLPRARIALTGYKIVKKGFKFEVPPTSANVNRIQEFKPIVIARVHKEKAVQGRDRDVVKPGIKKAVVEGLNYAKKIMQEIGEEASKGLVPMPFERAEYKSQHGEMRKELEMDWFNGDFLKLATTGTLPLEMTEENYISFNAEDRLGVLIEVSNTLQHFHDKGYVHRDLKPQNILVEVNQDQSGKYTLSGKVADFDLTQRIGKGSGSSYFYWSPLSQSGIVTPDCDIYGLAISLGESMFTNFYKMLSTHQQEVKNAEFDKLFSDMLPQLAKDREMSKILYDAFDPKKNPSQDNFRVLTVMNYLKQEIKKNPSSLKLQELLAELEDTRDSIDHLPQMYILGDDLFKKGVIEKTKELFSRLNLDFSLISQLMDTSGDLDAFIKSIDELLAFQVANESHYNLSLSPDQKKELINFRAEISQLPAMWKLMTSQIQKSYEFFLVYKDAKIDSPEGHEDEILDLMKGCGILSAAEFAQDLQQIQQNIRYLA